MASKGYIPPIDGAKRGSTVDKFLQYRKRFQETIAHNGSLPATWFADHLKGANGGFNVPNNANVLGTTNH